MNGRRPLRPEIGVARPARPEDKIAVAPQGRIAGAALPGNGTPPVGNGPSREESRSKNPSASRQNLMHRTHSLDPNGWFIARWLSGGQSKSRTFTLTPAIDCFAPISIIPKLWRHARRQTPRMVAIIHSVEKGARSLTPHH